jgi:CBS domain-containing protein
VRHFPVVDRDNKLLGLVSYTDVMLASSSSMSAERERRDVLIHKAVKAKDVMQRDIMTVRHDEDILDAGNVMMLKHLSCLVVTDEHNTLIGILTEHDFVKAALDFLEAL